MRQPEHASTLPARKARSKHTLNITSENGALLLGRAFLLLLLDRLFCRFLRIVLEGRRFIELVIVRAYAEDVVFFTFSRGRHLCLFSLALVAVPLRRNSCPSRLDICKDGTDEAVSCVDVVLAARGVRGLRRLIFQRRRERRALDRTRTVYSGRRSLVVWQL